MLSFADQQGFGLQGLVRSPLLGPKGNAEFLAWFVYPGGAEGDLSELVARVVPLENSP